MFDLCPISFAVIRFFLLQNRAGKTRLAKYYSPFSDGEKRKMEEEIYRLIATRDSKITNFLEASSPL
jgi:AP-2 complex subunit sigma-1